MARGLPALLLLLTLALPAGAEAKTVKVTVPDEGNLSVAQYRAKVPKGVAPTVRIANARRLGDTKVIVAVARVRRRTHEVTVVAMNPTGAAAAGGTRTPQVVVEARFVLVKRSFLDDVLDGLERSEVRGLRRFCQSPTASDIKGVDFGGRGIGPRRNVFRASATFLCHEGDPAGTDPARQRLNGAGVSVPPCRGTVSSRKENQPDVVVALVCGKRTDVIAFRAQDGNVGANCLADQGTICQFGQGCQPLPPESVCYFRPDGFLPGSVYTARAQWTAGPPFPSGLPFIQGMSLDPGGQGTSPALLLPLI